MPEDKKTEGKDVEMKDASKDGKEEVAKKEEKKEPPKDPKTVLIEQLGLALRTISASVASGETRAMGRVIRLFANLRRTMMPEVLQTLVQDYVDAGNPHKALYLSLVPATGDVQMATESKAEGEKSEKAPEAKLPTIQKPLAPEIEAFAVLLLLLRLFDQKEKAKAFECVNALVPWLKAFNRPTLNLFSARAFFYFSLAYEQAGRLSEIRPELLAAYRTACLRHDSMGQATLLNLLLRNYLAFNLYEQALKLVQKTNFPESRPNAQYARYLLYIGQIKAVQLEYSDSHSKLMQAIRKSPQSPNVALGFKLCATKLAIVVELLMGGVPDRTTFMQKEMKEQLRPYYAITQAVRSGDLNSFKDVVQQHEALFKKDKTLTLINRLRYNVIKTGLRSISLSYSRISLEDICTKLSGGGGKSVGLETPQDAAGIVAKAIVDGVIDANIDYDGGFVKSKQRHEIYSSCEPQKALHKRIAFCLQMRNDSVKAMAYPEEDGKDKEDAEKRREREKREMANVDDDDDGDDMML
jgi:26S proteasome regulatory subunit N3